MPEYSITTIEQLCERIASLNDDNCSNLLQEIDPKIFTCRIHIEGEGYDGHIPGFLLSALSELQTSAMRTYSFLQSGKEDLRGLHKDDLWTSIEVKNGSLDIYILFALLGIGLGKAMFENLTPKQRIAVLIGVGFLICGYFGLNTYQTRSNEKIETKRIESTEKIELEKIKAQKEIELEKLNKESQNENEREKTIREAFETIQKIVSQNKKGEDALSVANKNAKSGIECVIRGARGATRIDVWDTVYGPDKIRKIQTPESQPVNRYSKEGLFQIVQINTENNESWKVSLRNIDTKEKITATVNPENLFLSLDRAKELLDYQKDEKILRVNLAVCEKLPSINYSIDQIEVVES